MLPLWRNSPLMSEEQHKEKSSQQRYIPATSDTSAGFLLHVIRFPIALQDAPGQVCGTAHRVGYAHLASGKQAVYRLKLRMNFAGRKTATLPGFFILVNGVFEEYEPE